jgi:hypothetical protein
MVDGCGLLCLALHFWIRSIDNNHNLGPTSSLTSSTTMQGVVGGVCGGCSLLNSLVPFCSRYVIGRIPRPKHGSSGFAGGNHS